MPEISAGEDRLGSNGDWYYEQLIQVHQGLEPEESMALNARLILLMANEIADPEVLKQLLSLVKTKK